MPHSVGLDVSQKTTAICVVDAEGRRVWRGTCPTDPCSISQLIFRHAGAGAKLGVETGAMTPWLVHGLRAAGLDFAVLDARRVKAALQMRLNTWDDGLIRKREPGSLTRDFRASGPASSGAASCHTAPTEPCPPLPCRFWFKSLMSRG
jgi:hypothetical protein